jgi:hypothetical protein
MVVAISYFEKIIVSSSPEDKITKELKRTVYRWQIYSSVIGSVFQLLKNGNLTLETVASVVVTDLLK